MRFVSALRTTTHCEARSGMLRKVVTRLQKRDWGISPTRYGGLSTGRHSTAGSELSFAHWCDCLHFAVFRPNRFPGAFHTGKDCERNDLGEIGRNMAKWSHAHRWAKLSLDPAAL
jgi:hypothetical protein